jgi:Superinfection immunity protein
VHAVAAVTGTAGGAASAVGVLIAILIGASLYFVPWIVAGIRHVPNLGSVIVINLFLGWTVIGWVVALAMACRSLPQPQQHMVPPGYFPPSGPGYSPQAGHGAPQPYQPLPPSGPQQQRSWLDPPESYR